MTLTPIKKPRPKPCRCHVCTRERKLERMAKKLTPSEARWLMGFGDYAAHLEQQVAILSGYVAN